MISFSHLSGLYRYINNLINKEFAYKEIRVYKNLTTVAWLSREKYQKYHFKG